MKTKTNNGRANLGLLFVAIGVIFIMNTLNLIPDIIHDVIFSWQMLLIAIGVFNLFSKNYTPAIILLTIGVLFMIPEIIYIDYNYRKLFWPAALIVTGIVLIVRRNKGFDKTNFLDSKYNSTEYIDHASIFGGNKTMYASKNFKGGRVTSIFGGSEVNFHNSQIDGNVAVIDVFTIFGGSKFIIPQDWDAQIDVIAIFGGFTDKRFMGTKNFATDDINQTNKTLIIKGFTIFGGGDIRNA